MEGQTQGNTAPAVDEPLVTLDTIIDGVQPNTPAAPEGTPVPAPVEPIVPTTPAAQTPPPSGELATESFETTLPVLIKADEALTAEEKELKTGLLDVFKASNIDKSGNLLNDKNEIIFTAAQLKDYIENDKLPLNDKGELVNAKGEVVATNEEPLPLVDIAKNALSTQLGIDVSHLKVEDTEDGLVTVVEEAVKIGRADAIIDFLEGDYRLKQFYQHLLLGNEPNTFVQDMIDYKKINLTTLDNNSKEDLLARYYKKQGIVNPTNIIEGLKKGGQEIVDAELATAVTYLDQKQHQDIAERDAKIREQVALERQQVEQYWNKVNETVKAGKLGSINIPIKDKDTFMDYLSKPVDAEGNSAEMLDEAKEDINFQLMVSFLRFKKYDISKLAEVIAKENKALTLRERVNQQKAKAITDTGVPTTGQHADDNLSLERILG